MKTARLVLENIPGTNSTANIAVSFSGHTAQCDIWNGQNGVRLLAFRHMLTCAHHGECSIMFSGKASRTSLHIYYFRRCTEDKLHTSVQCTFANSPNSSYMHDQHRQLHILRFQRGAVSTCIVTSLTRNQSIGVMNTENSLLKMMRRIYIKQHNTQIRGKRHSNRILIQQNGRDEIWP